MTDLTHAAPAPTTEPALITLGGSSLYQGDAREVLASLPGNSVDAIVTDPPYGLSKEPDIAEVLTHWLAGDDYTHTGSGFMGATWDSFVPGPALWREAYRVLKPGGYAAVFASTRTYDLMVTSLRLAGFQVIDTLMWMQGCLTDDAEILTEDGWKRGLDVGVGDRVAQWSPETGEISIAAIEETFRYAHDGPMRVIRNERTDQLLTPTHRVYHRPRNRQMVKGHRRAWYDAEWEVATAEELSTTNPFRVPLAGSHDGPGIGGLDYAALLAWVWTEGGFDDSGTGVRIYQSSVNQPHCDEIQNLMHNRLAQPYKRYDRTRNHTRRDGETYDYIESMWFFTGDLARRVRADLPYKHPSYALLWRMTRAEKEEFLRVAMLGDGSGYSDGNAGQFHQKSREDLEWFQTLLLCCERTGRVTMRTNRDGGTVSLNPNSDTLIAAKHLKTPNWQDYTGEVWCVRVPTGAFIARRNGLVFITGNSGFPKSVNISKQLEKAGRPELAAQFDGYGNALKPAHEPIALVRKPLEGRYIDNVMTHGTGVMNIDACRIKNTNTDPDAANRDGEASAERRYTATGGTNFAATPGPRGGAPEGRYPANLLFSHAPECVPVGQVTVKAPVINRFTDGAKPFGGGAGHPYESAQTGDSEGNEALAVYACVLGCPVRELDNQSGVRTSGKPGTYRGTPNRSAAYGAESRKAGEAMTGYGDSGGASRFFSTFHYVKKATQKERPVVYIASGECVKAGHSPDPHDPALDWQVAASPVETICAVCTQPWVTYQHPTVKPPPIMAWLLNLLTPTGGVALDLFAGTGTTGEAATQTGHEVILIERDPAHVAMIAARLGDSAVEQSEIKEPQPSLFD